MSRTGLDYATSPWVGDPAQNDSTPYIAPSVPSRFSYAQPAQYYDHRQQHVESRATSTPAPRTPSSIPDSVRFLQPIPAAPVPPLFALNPYIGNMNYDNKAASSTIWTQYLEKSEHYDKDLVEDANNTVSLLLIFAGLFSAVISSFIAQTYPMLQQDPNDILRSIYTELRTPGVGTAQEVSFIPPVYAIRVNCCLFAGLIMSMLVAFLGIMVKEWTRSYQRDLAGVFSPHLRARVRHTRYIGAKKWHLIEVVGLLSVLMHMALFVSAIGIVDLLLSTFPIIGQVTVSLLGIGFLFFIGTSILPLFVINAPFRSPLSSIMLTIKKSVLHHMKTYRGSTPAQGEDGLEALRDEVPHKETEEIRTVRTMLHLDLDIICHMLGTVDKDTERPLMDKCFERLPQLTLLEKQDPERILMGRFIIEAYSFLAAGCVSTNEGVTGLVLPRFERAKCLCRFLSWFLSIKRSSEIQVLLHQRITHGGFNPYDLPNALAAMNTSDSRTLAISAIGRLQHLYGPEPLNLRCTICQSTFETAKNSESPTQPIGDMQKILEFLIFRTECLLSCEKTAENQHLIWLDPSSVTPHIDYLYGLFDSLFRGLPPGGQATLAEYLESKKAVASKDVVTRWFTPISNSSPTLRNYRRP